MPGVVFIAPWVFLALVLLASNATALTNAVDQAALIAFWNGLTFKAGLGWNTTASLCGQGGVTCSGGKVTLL